MNKSLHRKSLFKVHSEGTQNEFRMGLKESNMGIIHTPAWSVSLCATIGSAWVTVNHLRTAGKKKELGPSLHRHCPALKLFTGSWVGLQNSQVHRQVLSSTLSHFNLAWKAVGFCVRQVRHTLKS